MASIKTEKKNTPAPTLEKIGLKIKRQKPTEHISSTLKKISYLTVQNGGQNVTARHVESLDMQKKPFHYWQATFAPDQIELEWTHSPTQTSTQRKLHVTKNLFELLALLEHAYPVTASQFRPLLLETLENAQNEFFKNAGQLALDNDAMHRRIKQAENLKRDFEAAIDRLNRQVSTLSEENDQLKNRITKLDHISDEYLKTKIMQAVAENNEFKPQVLASVLNLPFSRIEAALDDLVKQGYLQPIK